MHNCAHNHPLICFDDEACPLCALQTKSTQQLEQRDDEIEGLQEELQEKRAELLDLKQQNAAMELVRPPRFALNQDVLPACEGYCYNFSKEE